MKTETPQYLTVLNYLLLGMKLTSLEALTMFGIISFPKRISQIEDIGIKVDRKTTTVKGRFGEKRVNVYWISQNKLSI
jgi:hypothetical protein